MLQLEDRASDIDVAISALYCLTYAHLSGAAVEFITVVC